MLKNTGSLFKGIGDFDLAASWMGWHTSRSLYSAAAVGAPHQRDRVWFIASPTATARSNMGATLKQVREKQPLKDRKNEKGTGGQISLTDFLIYHAMIALSTDPAKLNQTMPFEIQEMLLRVLPSKDQF